MTIPPLIELSDMERRADIRRVALAIGSVWTSENKKADRDQLAAVFELSAIAAMSVIEEQTQRRMREQVEIVSEFFSDGFQQARVEIAGLRAIVKAAEKRHAARHEKLAARGPDSPGERP